MIQPSSVRQIGEPIGQTTVELNSNHWVLTSKGKVNSSNLDEHVDYLLSQLFPKRQQLSKLQQEASFSLTAHIETPEQEIWPELEPTTVKGLAELNLNLKICIVNTAVNTVGD